jgi:hypothetical protein
MTVIELDAIRRASLGRIGRHDGYIVHEEPDGTLIFEPAVVLSELEARFLANPKLMQQIEDNRQHPERRRPRPRRGEVG